MQKLGGFDCTGWYLDFMDEMREFADQPASVETLKEMKSRKRKLVDPLQFEMSIQAEDLSGYIPAFGWEAAPPTEGQIKTLEKLGIFPDEIESAGKATKILDRLSMLNGQV